MRPVKWCHSFLLTGAWMQAAIVSHGGAKQELRHSPTLVPVALLCPPGLTLVGVSSEPSDGGGAFVAAVCACTSAQAVTHRPTSHCGHGFMA